MDGGCRTPRPGDRHRYLAQSIELQIKNQSLPWNPIVAKQSVAIAITLLLATVAHSQDKVQVPQDVPPVVGMALSMELSDDPEAHYQVELVMPSIRYKIVPRENRKGKVASWNQVVANAKSSTRVLKFGTPSQIPDSRIVDINGKELSAKSILKRLENRSPVLVSVSGRMVDPYYLQLAKKDVVIIILSRRDGMGDSSLLPIPDKDQAKSKDDSSR